ncbi:MAG: 4Fe-4S dicluster domain-containing protein [candidate division Zixibacteria bacterium]|nr:4Fe-4S dicluster domain-containing protein [candidate division Zixibacteria bacterium]
MPGIIIDKLYCKGCELCVHACPMQIISMSKEINQKGYFYATVYEPSRCIGCRICAITCPDAAIEVKAHGTHFTLFKY